MRRRSIGTSSANASNGFERGTGSEALASDGARKHASLGKGRNWHYPSDDEQQSASFAERVYALVRQVPPGRVITYGAIALVLGKPNGAREVGWAMAVCPDGVPAQRVINARGEVSGGQAGVRRKQLEADGVAFLPGGRVDLDRYLWLPD